VNEWVNGCAPATAGELLVLDDAWRDELVNHRDHNRCTAARPRNRRNPDGRCKSSATVVVPVDNAGDYRAVSAWQSLCYSHHYEMTHSDMPTDELDDGADGAASLDSAAGHAA